MVQREKYLRGFKHLPSLKMVQREKYLRGFLNEELLRKKLC
jgi:hypothetical protein